VTLSSLIRKGALGNVATATTATLATQEERIESSVAKVATVAVADLKCPNNEEGSKYERWALMDRLISTLGIHYRVQFPEGTKGVPQWVRANCPDLARRIDDLEARMEMECLAPVVSLDEFRGIVQGWVDAYLEGFGRYKAKQEKVEVRQ
jgi:hypothetical protein